MHGEIHLAIQQCLVQFGDKELLALHLAQRYIKDAVTARFNADDFDCQVGVVLLKLLCDGSALRQRQQGLAGAEFKNMRHRNGAVVSTYLQSMRFQHR